MKDTDKNTETLSHQELVSEVVRDAMKEVECEQGYQFEADADFIARTKNESVPASRPSSNWLSEIDHS